MALAPDEAFLLHHGMVQGITGETEPASLVL
jgi:hypothetical protein